jgi:outer membrane receptor protein involved in Fe transport
VPVLPNTFSFVNAGNTRQRGVELAARLDWTDVTVRGSYTFQATPTLKDNTTPYPLEINRPARNKASVGATYARDAWTVSSDLTYTGRAFWADVLTEQFWGYTDSFANVDAQARYQLPGDAWQVWVSATDLLNRRIKAHVYGDTITRRVVAGLNWQLRTR